MPSGIPCAVCSKALRNPISVRRGTGPVCAKHVGEFLRQIAMERAARIRESWARDREHQPVGMTAMAIANAKARFLARIRRQYEVPVYSGTIADAFSATRQRIESLSFDRFSDAAVAVHSESGREYVITTDRTGETAVACSCPDHQHRHRMCRHMTAYNALAAERAEVRRAEREQAEAAERAAREPQIENRVTSAPTILNHIVEQEAGWDRERDRALYAWAEQHSHDGVFVSEDDRAWEALRASAANAEGLGPYERDTVLDHSGLTFGIELEVEGVYGSDVARALKRAGLSQSSLEQSYRTLARDQWIVKSDGSLVNGCEVVSPPLRDEPETWAAIEEVTNILREHGARTSNRTGFHIHLSHEVLDDRGYRWQRLARYMFGFPMQYYRMGAASHSHDVTWHRGTAYAAPLHEHDVRRISRTDTAMEASRKMIGYLGHGSRYKIINTAKFIEHHVPTVEFRYPNGTIDPIIVQRQIQLANATMMQAAYLRKRMPGADRLPALFRGDHSINLSQDNNMRFRQYLDTLGSKRLRRIATALWVRGAF
ncbi:MAG: amidoligase family protein [Alicyclobacillus sp.]|nr:amidoligase family protein [Alicyclobacillus sp.]